MFAQIFVMYWVHNKIIHKLKITILPLTFPTHHILNWNYYCIIPTKPVPLPFFQWKVASSLQAPYHRNQESVSDGHLLATTCNCPEHQTTHPSPFSTDSLPFITALKCGNSALTDLHASRSDFFPKSFYSLCFSKRDYPHNLRKLVVFLYFQKYKSNHP